MNHAEELAAAVRRRPGWRVDEGDDLSATYRRRGSDSTGIVGWKRGAPADVREPWHAAILIGGRASLLASAYDAAEAVAWVERHVPGAAKRPAG